MAKKSGCVKLVCVLYLVLVFAALDNNSLKLKKKINKNLIGSGQVLGIFILHIL